MKKGLVALAFGTLALGMTEFLMMGILPDVANGLNVSIVEAGHLISAYALGVCCGAPLLTVVNKYSPKSILLFLVSLILLGAVLCSVATSYPVFLVSRFIAGLPHGAYFGVASIAAVKLADENHKTGAVSIMIAGMTVANLFGNPFVLTGNYPYDISSQIFFKMLDYKDFIPCCTGMIQREVAQRIASAPGNKAYGILSVMIQAWYDVEYLFTVDEGVFNPPPKVKSAVIRMTRNATTDLGCDEQLFKRVVKTVFNQRRKMLRVSLKQIFAGKEVSPDFFAQEVMTRRPEQLSVAEFVELTNLVAGELG